MPDSTLPSLDAIQARADAATDGPWEASGSCVGTRWTGASDWSGPIDDRELVATASPVDAEFIASARSDVPVLVAALRAVLDVAAPHTEWLARREAKLGRAESCACDTCTTVRAVTAHIDTTPKEKP